jgi:hypothetical protein
MVSDIELYTINAITTAPDGYVYSGIISECPYKFFPSNTGASN